MTFSIFLRPIWGAITLLLALQAPVALAGPQDDLNVANAALIAGQAAQRRGDHRRAIEYFSVAINKTPDFDRTPVTAAYTARGLSYFTLGQYDLVVADFDQVIAEPGPMPTLTVGTAHLWRGYANFKLKNYRQAIRDFDNALAEKSNGGVIPTPYNLYRLLGMSKAHLGDREQAIADINEAISLKPDAAFAYADLAQVYSDLGDQESAIENLAQAVRLDPNDSGYHDRLLTACRLLDDDKPAACNSIR